MRVDAFVVVVPGLEPLVLDEVVRLGVRPARIVRGGVACTVTWPQLWSMHLRLRMATRVLVRVARFRADGPGTLTAGLRRIDWNQWLPEGGVDVRGTVEAAPGLTHSGVVVERTAAVIGREAGMQIVQVRVVGDDVTVSLDATGEPLHRRSWRSGGGAAPLRPTLAAALIVSSRWDRRRPLVDPFCGAGTVAIEAAMLARRMAPGRHRTFAFSTWPSFDAERWTRLVAGVDGDVVERGPLVMASDRDAGAVDTTRAAAASAGVEIVVEQRTISELVAPPGRAGWVVTNPPWGHRLGDRRALIGLYDRWGRVLGAQFAGWHVAVLAPPSTPVEATGLAFDDVVHTTSGGIGVAVRRGTVPIP